MYEYNAGIDIQKAGLIRQASDFTDFQAGKIQEELIGAQRAGFAGAGVQLDTGTPLDVMTQSLSESYLDREIQKYNSEVAARSFESEAQLQRMYGKDVRKQGKINAFATLLETAGDFGSSQI